MANEISNCFIAGLVNECDYTERKYNSYINGAWIVAQSATGRYCAVMYVGPEYIKKFEIKLANADDIRKEIESFNDGSTADF